MGKSMRLPDGRHIHVIGDSALVDAIQWLVGLLTGSLGTAIAVIAIATIGFAMLQGRLPICDGIRVIIGCFIFFGAPVIAAGLMVATQGGPAARRVPDVALPASVPTPTKPAFDPYAGASVPNQ